MKCKLSLDVNKCPFFDKEKMECNNTDSCSFQDIENTQERYERKERWYEKYYKDSKSKRS